MFSLLNRLSVRNRIWMIVAIVIGGVALGGIIDVLMLRQTLWHEKESAARQLVETGYGVLSHYHALQERGVLDDGAAKAGAIATLRSMRYNGRDYFWLNDLGSPLPRIVMHPSIPDVEGKTLEGARYNCATGLRVGTEGVFQPTDGKMNLTAAFIDVVTRGDHGYVTYSWPKPLATGGSTAELYPKLSYVRKFAPWGWVIGTGIYVDDVDKLVMAQTLQHLGWTAFIALVLLLLASAIARSITRPLHSTLAFMDRIGIREENLARRLPNEGRSEIARMARGFNAMLDRLQVRDEELALHRAELESLVERRTASLGDAKLRLEQELVERKEAERALAASRASLNAMLDASGETMLLLDPEGLILAINACGAERFHQRPEALVGRNFFDLLPPELAESRRATMQHVISTGEHLESHDCRENIYFTNSVYPVKDAAGTVTSVAVQARNVTEQWRIEQVEGLFRRLDEMLLKWRMNLESICQMFCDDILPAFALVAAWIGRAEKDGRIKLLGCTESMGSGFLGKLSDDSLRWDADAAGSGMLETAIRKGLTANANLEDVPYLSGDFTVQPDGDVCVLVLPLVLRGETWGVLTLYGCDTAMFETGQMSIQLSTLARRLSMTIDAALGQEWLSLLDSALAGVGNAVIITDGEARILWANAAFARLSGYANESILGKTPALFSTGGQNDAFYPQVWRSIVAGATLQGDIVCARPDASRYTAHQTVTPLMDQDGLVSHYIVVLEDVSERKLLEERVQHAANYDLLTDLPNRGLFFDRLAQAMALARRENQRGALLFIDLDHFKDVNDQFGHAAGDRLLTIVAAHLREQVRESDTVARLAGDEFTVILPNLNQPEDATRVAEKILAALSAPVDMDGQSVSIGVSIGVAIFPGHGDSVESVVQEADASMYEAKRQGRNRICQREVPVA